MLKDYFYVAWQSLTHKKLRSWLTLLGIFIGVTAVVSLIGLGNGLKIAINSQFGVSSTEVISVQAGGVSGAGPPGAGVVNPLTEDDVEAIRKLPFVDDSFSRVIENVRIEYNDILDFGFVGNLPPGESRDFAIDVLELEAEFGRILREDSSKQIFVGYNFGQDDNDFEEALKVGDEIAINDVKFEIVGIGEKKGSFIFDNIIWMNDEDLRGLMSEEDQERVDVVAVRVKDKEFIDDTKEDIEQLMRKRRDVKIGEEDFEVSTPEGSLSTVNQILTGIQIFIVLIAGISIFIGSIGIVNTMFTSVVERRSQIGIMKAIGAKNSDIFMQFFIESGIMGFFGGLVGVIVGEAIAYYGTLAIASFVGSTIEPEINLILIFGTLIGSFLIGSISGIVPALQAARQKPVDALRG